MLTKNLRLIFILPLLLFLTGCSHFGGFNNHQQKPDPMVLKLQSYLTGTGIKVARVRHTNTFKLTLPSNITFQKNSTHLQPQFYPSLNSVAKLLKAYPKMLAKVAGHTDIYGTLRYNQLLSEKRAQTIADYLATRGIAKNRLQTAGYGINDPIASNKKHEGRVKNRRVEILLYTL